MSPMFFIGQALLKKFKCPIEPVPCPPGSRCLFDNREITEGIPRKKVISDTFAGHQYLRGMGSDWVSKEAVACLQPIVPVSSGGISPIRYMSFVVRDGEFKNIKQGDLFDVITDPELTFPNFICCNFSLKKHASYSGVVNYDRDAMVISTDNINVHWDWDLFHEVYPVLKSWYTALPPTSAKAKKVAKNADAKEDLKTAPTWFTKAQMLGEMPDPARVKAYGRDRFFEERAVLENHMGSKPFEFLVHILNKTPFAG